MYGTNYCTRIQAKSAWLATRLEHQHHNTEELAQDTYLRIHIVHQFGDDIQYSLQMSKPANNLFLAKNNGRILCHDWSVKRVWGGSRRIITHTTDFLATYWVENVVDKGIKWSYLVIRSTTLSTTFPVGTWKSSHKISLKYLQTLDLLEVNIEINMLHAYFCHSSIDISENL